MPIQVKEDTVIAGKRVKLMANYYENEDVFDEIDVFIVDQGEWAGHRFRERNFNEIWSALQKSISCES